MRERTPFDPTPLFYPDRLLSNIMNRYQVVRQEDQDKWRIWDSQTKQYLGWNFASKKDAERKIVEMNKDSEKLAHSKKVFSILDGNNPEKGRIQCSACGANSGRNLSQNKLVSKWATIVNWDHHQPVTNGGGILKVVLRCEGCGHSGKLTIAPSPFIETYKTHDKFSEALKTNKFKIFTQ